MNLEQAVGADYHISSLFSVYRAVGEGGGGGDVDLGLGYRRWQLWMKVLDQK